MATILEALKKESSIRVSYGGRWLVANAELPAPELDRADWFTPFAVLEQPYQKRVRVIYRGDSEDEAVRVLLGEE